MTFEGILSGFLKELEQFEYSLSGRDHVWNVLFAGEKERWRHLHITKYDRTFYVSDIDGEGGSLEVLTEKGVGITEPSGFSSFHPLEEDDYRVPSWKKLIASARKWLNTVRREWIKANKRIHAEYPLNYRYGTVSNYLVRESMSDICRLDKELGKTGTKKLIRLVEDGYFMKRETTEVSSMTAGDYFDYCRIAYIAGARRGEPVDISLSGKEMYRRYADGRHEGLLDIDEHSPQEFADWIDGRHPLRGGGGHPWEIKRGGNTTHIDLSVSRPSLYQKEGFKVELRGESIGRMVETMKMFLAIQEASLPISIANPEGVRKRLLGQDNIGLIPKYCPLHRANQHFHEHEDVYDVMYYDELGRFKRRITPFIRWEPLPILKPR